MAEIKTFDMRAVNPASNQMMRAQSGDAARDMARLQSMQPPPAAIMVHNSNGIGEYVRRMDHDIIVARMSVHISKLESAIMSAALLEDECPLCEKIRDHADDCVVKEIAVRTTGEAIHQLTSMED